MKRLMLFAGTTEGRMLAEFLADYPAEVYVSTATEYGKSCIGEQNHATVLAGRMNADEIADFIRAHQIELTVDATHPFAAVVTENIKKACTKTETTYLRCLREQEDDVSTGDEAAALYVSTIEEAIDYLQQTRGNILVTTGSKDLHQYTALENCHDRCYVRVLSTREAVAEAVRLGFEGRHLIAMQGPFSKEMNIALLRQVGADYMLTKETGTAGGFEEKKMAAAATGTTLIVIGRPAEQGLSLEETCKYINTFLIEGEQHG